VGGRARGRGLSTPSWLAIARSAHLDVNV